MPPKRPPSECPICGADIPPGAKACPECGADERTGWNEDETRYDGLDLPEEAFEKEGKKREPKKTVSIFWWVVGVGLTAILVCALLGLVR